MSMSCGVVLAYFTIQYNLKFWVSFPSPAPSFTEVELTTNNCTYLQAEPDDLIYVYTVK